ncbi:major facilitator transporter [Micrococcus luteus]|nr:major facilitator transporter [Micrococcus luteus]
MLADPRWVAPLCWIAVLLDGFDAVVLGAAMPKLTGDPTMGVDNANGTWLLTASLIGMTVGALAMGWLTDRLGRRRLLIGAVVAFSVLTVITGFATEAWQIGVLRLLAGLGLGGCLPTAISMVTEFARPGRNSHATTLVMTGYHVGAVLTAMLALWAASSTADGWRALFWLAGVPMLILVPLMWRFLPESADYLAAQGRHAEAHAVATHYGIEITAYPEAPATEELPVHYPYGDAAPVRVEGEGKSGAALLLSGVYRRNTIFVWVASFMGLMLVYGLNSWLPQIMRAADYDLGNALGFLLVLNAGAVVGLLIAGRVGDRITPRNAAILWFLGSALLLCALVIRLPLTGIYAMVFVTGMFVFSAQNLVYAFTATNYPPQVRGTALGMSAGVGRLGAISGPLLGGALLTAGIAYPWGFFAFAGAGVLGGLAASGFKTLRRA